MGTRFFTQLRVSYCPRFPPVNFGRIAPGTTLEATPVAAAPSAEAPSEEDTIRRGNRSSEPADVVVDGTPEAAMPTPEHSRPSVVLCGLPVPLTGKPLFLLLSVLYLSSAIGFAYLQEKVFDIPNFKFSNWMTFVTAATMAACGMLERLLTRDLNRVGTLAQYAALSVLTVSGMGLTNLSLNYLTYPTRVIFKSSKLLPTMAAGQPGQRGLARSRPGGRPRGQRPRRWLGPPLRLHASTRRVHPGARRSNPNTNPNPNPNPNPNLVAWWASGWPRGPSELRGLPSPGPTSGQEPPPRARCRWARCCSGASTPSSSTSPPPAS